MRVSSRVFISRTFSGEQQRKSLCCFFFCCEPIFVYIKTYASVLSLSSLTRRNTQYFSLAKAHTLKHYISRHVCFCSGCNCCTSPWSFVVFLCACAEQFFSFLMSTIICGVYSLKFIYPANYLFFILMCTSIRRFIHLIRHIYYIKIIVIPYVCILYCRLCEIKSREYVLP